jgi:uncharacterized protein (DUF2141 family)
MKKPIQAKSTLIKNGKIIVKFKNITNGEYSIICYHDKNNNKQMDFNSNGMPLEDYGSFNNKMSYGPPNFEDSKFLVKDKNVSLIIKF